MRTDLLKSLYFNLDAAEDWLELAKSKTNKCWLEDLGNYLFLLGKADKTALILRYDFGEDDPYIDKAREMQRVRFDEIGIVQEIHK